ncbi:hypothetical protein L596_002533 [Steinernema carpocapsae]|uniref:Amino acid permease/ SLC12A domain-containing protein n=1 Tax=Steinernema carpocapsae TaxID=34508 RepID=A0A4U8USD4_STECR|nr:hypothetical protein L596_002533 [Steinernema carpocapsae]
MNGMQSQICRLPPNVGFSGIWDKWPHRSGISMVNHNKMGLLGAISYIIGNIVGSGIFITPTSILNNTDSVGLSLIIWSVSALISILGAFCYVELGTSIRTSGADFAYLCYVKWYPLAFAFMCAGCILTYPATLAVQAQTFSEYVFKGCGSYCHVNDSADFWAKKLLAFALIWVLMFMNFFSVKRLVQYFQIGASIAKVLATALIIGTGFYFLIFKGKTENLSDPFPNSTMLAAGPLVTALFAGLFSYDGWDILNFGAEEIENPKRTMPLAIIIGLIIVAVIYVAVNISYFVVMTIPDIQSAPAVATKFAKISLGEDFQYIVPFLICIVLVGSLNSTMFSASRYLHAAARQGVIPTWISCTNKKEDSPRAALFLHILLSIIISFAGDLDTLISYLAFAQWSQRACTMVALLWIRFRHKPVHPDAITTPFVVPVIFFCVCAALVIVTIVRTIGVAAVGGGICIGGFIFYMIFIYHRALYRFYGYRSFLHKLNHATSVFAQITFNAMVDLHKEGDDQMVDELPSTDSEGDLNKVAPIEELTPRSFANSVLSIDGDIKKCS